MPTKSFENCPKCQAEVNHIQYGDIEVEACPNCKGFFLDYDDLKKSNAQAFENFGEWRRKDARVLDTLEIRCPKCSVKMLKRKSPKEEEILLDICPSCNGVWFDEGEFCIDKKTRPTKKMKLILKLVCFGCNYEADYSRIKSDSDELPKCPRCEKTLSFKGNGVIIYKERTSLVLFVVLVLFIPAFLWLFSYFNESDNRQINPNQPISIGEMIYSGQARVSVPDKWAMAPYGNGSRSGADLRMVRTAKMVTQHHSYIYKGIEDGVLKIEHEYWDSNGKQENEDLNLSVNGNIAHLEVPAIPQIEKSKPHKLEIRITDDKKLTVR